jgi:hypothetical protein
MREIHYDEAQVPAYVLPQPLRFLDGGTVSAADWPRRRVEILRLFEDHVYGRAPEALAEADVHHETLEEGPTLGDRALRRQVRIRIGYGGRSRDLPLLVLLPSPAPRPVPAFLGLNFFGNHTLSNDPAVPLPRSWVSATAGDRGQPHPTDAGRGRDAASWPLETVLGRGYALASLYCGDAEPDHTNGWTEGLRGLFAGDGADPHGWGAIGAWAQGLRYALEALQRVPGIDGSRVAVIGHSRLGKAALWAGAQDERFALVISNNSGCGGAALSRREYGETVARINASFPHWFCPAFRRYDDREADLPVDQHMLVSLIAPRLLYVTSASMDEWADPLAEFLSVTRQRPVDQLYGFQD